MRATCAWCADPQTPTEAVAVQSHGLCAPCLEARLEALRRADAAPAPLSGVPSDGAEERDAA
jgi:hypothetical protein